MIVCNIVQNPTVDIDNVVCDIMIPISKKYVDSVISIKFPAGNDEHWTIQMKNGEPFFDDIFQTVTEE